MIPRAKVRCDWDGHVYHAGKRVQFPKNLRSPGKEYIADLDEHSVNGAVKYYRARLGTICEEQIRTIRTRMLVNIA